MKKNIAIGGFTKEQREEELKTLKAKLKKKGYKFLKYIDNGTLKSVAVFEVEEEVLKKEKSLKLKRTGILFFILAIIIYIAIEVFNYINAPENISNKEARNLSLLNLKNISNNFVLEKHLDQNKYNEKFFSCLTQNIWEKDETSTVNAMLNLCYDDYENSTNHLMSNYFNVPKLLTDFCPKDGSHRPLEKIIKDKIYNSNSYKLISTEKSFVLNEPKPHMNVIMKFREKNQAGDIVASEVTAKVDALTYKLYDIKF